MKLHFFTLILTNFVLLALSATAHGFECDPVLSALQKERHLTQVNQTKNKQTTEFRDGSSITLSVSCGLRNPNIAIVWDGLAPDQAFYDLVGRAGSLVSKRSTVDIVKFSKQCRNEALKDETELASVEQQGLAIECQAFTRDGGGTTIFLFTE